MEIENDINNQFKFRRAWGPHPRYPKVLKYSRQKRSTLIKIAGPCSIEDSEQIHQIAEQLNGQGISYLRGGVFRAGTYPSPQIGFGFVKEELLNEFSRAAHENGMQCVMEILDYHPDSLQLYAKYSDAYQVGARAMQNYTLLNWLSRQKRPVFIKRNMGSTMDEFLGAAEWILQHGMVDPVLIERGSSTFHNHVRWDLSISIIPAIKTITQIPVLVDASHGTGRRDLVEPMTLAGVAAGADGFLIETHTNPDQSLSDSDQAISIENFKKLNQKVNKLHELLYL